MLQFLFGACGQRKKGRKSKKAKGNDPKVKDFFPTPTASRLQRGDFDILIVHKEYGFIIIEVCSLNSFPLLRVSFTTVRVYCPK